ncbi:COQ9_2 [Blepharisma stoltei]|uniref:Ubiquinone biosynthesis protein n=1 Tax=Blepharisma stoltei TaxID=1481888 RepID=A0AAU9J1U0_9CILI|nr:unnamed protein product [Blepharisma stoltei]
MSSTGKLKAIRKLILLKSQELAPTLGFSPNLFQIAAKETAVSPAIIGHIFPEGPVALVYHLMESWQEKLNEDAITNEVAKMSTKEKVYYFTKRRMEYIIPYKDVWKEAMTMGASPSNVFNTTKILWDTWDLILNLSSETPSLQYFAIPQHLLARAAYGRAYLFTEIYFLTDSPDFSHTWKFLEGQVDSLYQQKSAVNTLLDISQFTLNAQYRVLESFYPQPKFHNNPIVK